MTDRPLDQRERRELCDLLLHLGPDAPTLCEGWDTLDLAAHLVIREREPLTTPGLLWARFAGYTQRRRDTWADKGLDAVVAKIRSGPPAFPWSIPKLRTILNLNEYAIHHEDVRRANGLARRSDRPDLEDAIWRLVKSSSRLATRKLPDLGLDLVRPDGERHVVKRGRAKRGGAKKGDPIVELTGHPLELALFLAGRKGAADVALTGPDAAVAAVQAAELGV